MRVGLSKKIWIPLPMCEAWSIPRRLQHPLALTFPSNDHDMIQRQGLAFLNRYKYEEKNCGIAYHQALSYQSSPSRTVSLFSNIFVIAIPSPKPCVLPESWFQRAGLRVFGTTCPLCTSSSACQQTWKTFSVLVANSTYSNWREAESKVKRSSPFFWIFFLTKMLGLYFTSFKVECSEIVYDP